MPILHLLLPSTSFFPSSPKIHLPRASINADRVASPPPKPARRGRKKSTTTTTPKTPTTKKPRKIQKSQPEAAAEEDLQDFDDGIDFPYEDPPLVCCFGYAQKEFSPANRVSPIQMHPDMYCDWRLLQFDPPEFARAIGGPAADVAVAHAKLGGRAAFLGKVGDDVLGKELVLTMNKEKVQTRGVKIVANEKTALAFMRFKFDETGKMRAEEVKPVPEDTFLASELNLSVLKEAKVFYFGSQSLVRPSMRATLFKAIAWAKKFGSLIFFDVNLPMALWRSPDETRLAIKEALEVADIVEFSMPEFEWLTDEEHHQRRRQNKPPQYYAEAPPTTKEFRDYYHYTREEVLPFWHDKMKVLFVTDGTIRINYYTPTFHGSVVGTEDTMITTDTCDRSGSGDVIAAAIIRKLLTHPEMYEDEDVMQRQLRFVVCAGIIAQWTRGTVIGFPTEEAVVNLKETVYIPDMW